MALNKPLSHVTAPADPNVEGTNSGMNAGSNFCGIGIATGEYGFKTSDWPAIEIDPMQTQAIGGSAVDLKAVDYENADFNELVALMQAEAETASGAELGSTGYYNETAVTVPADAWLFGVTQND